MLGLGADINVRSASSGATNVSKCVSGGNYETLEFLISHGANINLNNSNNESPLNIACKLGYRNIISLLLDSGALINEIDNGSRTPLMLACILLNVELVNFLINTHNADIHICDRWGYDALMFVSKLSSPKAIEIANLLTDKGADVNRCDKNFNNSLMHACLKGNMNMAKFLIEKGANENNLNYDDSTPFNVIENEVDKISLIKFARATRKQGINIKKPINGKIILPIWLKNINDGDGYIPIVSKKFITLEDDGDGTIEEEEELFDENEPIVISSTAYLDQNSSCQELSETSNVISESSQEISIDKEYSTSTN
jgi:ankyrin repeat protein